MSDYSEKLKDPRWQKKRLQILERDNWTCLKCNATDKTLNVHHKYYELYENVWDYPTYALITLCSDCHKEEHASKREYEKMVINHFYNTGANLGLDLMRLNELMCDAYIGYDYIIQLAKDKVNGK